MRMNKLGSKLTLIVLITMVVMTVVTVSMMAVGSHYVVDEIIKSQAQSSMNAVLSRIDMMKEETLEAAIQISENPNLAYAVSMGSRASLMSIISTEIVNSRFSVDFVVISDTDGTVLVRTHTDRVGDSIAGQRNVQEALRGNSDTYIESGNEIRLTLRSSAPIRNSSGEIVGVISAGYSLVDEDLVDELNLLTGSEISIFFGDEIVSTSMTANGQRKIGDTFSSQIADRVLGRGETFVIDGTIGNLPYMKKYAPILDFDGNAIGAFFVGNGLSEVHAAEFNNTLMAVIVVAIMMVIASIALTIYFRKMISIPLDRLRHNLSEVANGNFNVNTQSNSSDEIGELTRTTKLLIDNITLLTEEMNHMSTEFKNGETDARIDSSKFRGSYRVVAESINDMCSESTQELYMVLDCMAQIANGSFDSDIPRQPGKKVIMNETLDGMRTTLKAAITEMKTLVGYAKTGDLGQRAIAENYQGDWFTLMTDLNVLIKAIVLPVKEAAEVLEQVSTGDFQVRVNGNYSGEFLAMKTSINTMVENISSYIQEISTVLGEISNDNLDQEITREYLGEFSSIKQSVNTIIIKFNSIISEMYSAANQVSNGAKQISESSIELAQGTSQQASSVEELNSTISIINSNTSQNAKSAKDAEGLSMQSKESASRGDSDMKDMLVAMDSIKESSNKISNIIKVIDDIAFQTNLLALNAAVEAARAGDYGKGFAVVAEEVRSLASRSKDAAQETAGLIEESISRVDGGITIANRTANALQDIVDDVTKVAGIITDISVSSIQQSESISHVTDGIMQITDVVQKNSAASQETASAAEELSSQSEVLRNLISNFNTKK